MKSKLAFFSLAIVSASLMSAAQSATPAAQSATPATKSGAWLMQQSGTTASLRGIHAVNDNVAWASGTHGTILKTTDGGANWQKCAVPPGAEKLDFRGIWAWDADTAVALSSGPADQSRIYKTTDGCKSWKLAATNGDKTGFWDDIIFPTEHQGFVLGDPVGNEFAMYITKDRGDSWFPTGDPGLDADPKTQGAFAASNSGFISLSASMWFGTGGKAGAFVYSTYLNCDAADKQGMCPLAWRKAAVPIAGGTDGAGVFSLAVGLMAMGGRHLNKLVAVGGDYEKPNEPSGTAAYSLDGGKTWAASATPPRGYRSAVAWFPAQQAFIAAGSSGSDYSLDFGKTWRPLDDGNWNALGLPFAVGPKGQIGKLNPAAIPAK
jgi:hypothetical protein